MTQNKKFNDENYTIDPHKKFVHKTNKWNKYASTVREKGIKAKNKIITEYKMRWIELANYGKMNTSFKLISIGVILLGWRNLLSGYFVVNNTIMTIGDLAQWEREIIIENCRFFSLCHLTPSHSFNSITFMNMHLMCRRVCVWFIIC